MLRVGSGRSFSPAQTGADWGGCEELRPGLAADLGEVRPGELRRQRPPPAVREARGSGARRQPLQSRLLVPADPLLLLRAQRRAARPGRARVVPRRPQPLGGAALRDSEQAVSGRAAAQGDRQRHGEARARTRPFRGKTPLPRPRDAAAPCPLGSRPREPAPHSPMGYGRARASPHWPPGRQAPFPPIGRPGEEDAPDWPRLLRVSACRGATPPGSPIGRRGRLAPPSNRHSVSGVGG